MEPFNNLFKHNESLEKNSNKKAFFTKNKVKCEQKQNGMLFYNDVIITEDI